MKECAETNRRDLEQDENNRRGARKLAVMTVQCDVPLVVRKDKVKDFVKQKRDPELDKQIAKVISKLGDSIDTSSLKK